jgi:peptide/nickel transport system permease protein
VGHALLEKLLAFLQFDFGTSAISGAPAADELAARLPVTLFLAGTGLVVALAIGAPLGILLGSSPVRRAAAPLIQIVAATPVFCASLVLAYAAMHLAGWPVSTNIATPFAKLADPQALELLLPPILTVGAAGAAAVQLALRRAAREASDESYQRGLRKLGLTGFEIERIYVAPQVAAGLLSSLGEVVLALLSATAVAEWVFNAPGAAVLFVKSAALHDWTMLALILLVFVAMVLTAHCIGRIAARAIYEQRHGA